MYDFPSLLSRVRSLLPAVLLIVVVLVGGGLAFGRWADAATVGPPTRLKAAGPTNGENGFPVWYKDSDNFSVGLCLDASNRLCGFLPGDVPDPDRPISFPDNYPDEAFYMLAGSTINLPSGVATLTTGLESAFSSATPTPGAQITFGRIRIRVNTPGAGHYRVTHPYGVEEFDVTAAGNRSINFVDDVGVAERDFTGVLKSRIDPFLRWDTGFYLGPDGASYLGDPAVAHKVTGSTLGTNFFRIEGPNIGGPGVDSVTQNLFTLQGKVATNAGIAPQSAVYTQTTESGGFLDVFGSTQPEQSIKISGSGLSTTTLRGDGDGRYLARVAYSGTAPPASVQITNASDRPRTDVDVTVTDQVRVSSARYDADTRTLVIQAASSDQAHAPRLTATGIGDLNDSGEGTFDLADRTLPPATVTVVSSRSGSGTIPVSVVGAAFDPDEVSAQTPATLLVQQGQKVVLDGSGTQNATSYRWIQEDGTPQVTITDAESAVASFVAPGTLAQLTFRLSATGPGGPSTARSVVTVQPVAPPIANAGAPQSVLQETAVTLDGAGSQGATAYAWTQTGGVPVTLNGRTGVRPTFTMPVTNDPLLFQLTVTGPGGTDVAVAQISPRPDVLTVDSAEFRTSKGEWRVTGTASVTTTNAVTVWIGGKPGTGTRVGTPATVDALGVWSVRIANGPAPGTLRTVSLTSTRGGSLTAAPLTVRN